MTVKKLTRVTVQAKIGDSPTEITLETQDDKTIIVTLSDETIATVGAERPLTIALGDLRDAINSLTNYGNIIVDALKDAFKTENSVTGTKNSFFGSDTPKRRY